MPYPKQSITIKRAKRILGKKAEHYSDDQTRELIHTLKLLAREGLLYNGSKIKEKDDGRKHPEIKA